MGSSPKSTSREDLQADTLRRKDRPARGGPETVPALSILYHRDLRRVGEHARLWALSGGREVRVSRLEPAFVGPDGREAGPLADPHVSRTPFVLGRKGAGIELSCDPERGELRLDGVPVTGPVAMDFIELDPGRVIDLAGEVLLLLHLLDESAEPVDSLGMVGLSERLDGVRREVSRVADLDDPVLIVGESGVGKELVARAIHENSPRRRKPYVCMNMAAVSPSMAAAELFGHARGAFTGATESRKGFFAQAEGGTLFLDEIGRTPDELQGALLRVLDSGELQPVGGRTRQSSVRLLAATDADLAAEVADGRFRLPLLYRLSGYDIQVPPLRERPLDVPVLLLHFLREKLDQLGEQERLSFEAGDEATRPWLSAAVVALLVAHDWPGNVRELRNFAHKLAISTRGRREPVDVQTVSAMLAPAGPGGAARPAPPAQNHGRTNHVLPFDKERIVEALRRHAYSITRAADEVGCSRTTVYRVIEASLELRTPKELEADEIAEAAREHGGDIEAMARALEVSPHGLRIRMKELGMSPRGEG